MKKFRKIKWYVMRGKKVEVGVTMVPKGCSDEEAHGYVKKYAGEAALGLVKWGWEEVEE